MSGLRIDVADLLTHPGARRAVHLEAAVDGLARRRPDRRAGAARPRARAGPRRHRRPRQLHARWEPSAARACATSPPSSPSASTSSSSRAGRRRDVPDRRSRDRSRAAGARRVLLELPLAPTCDDAHCAPATVPGVSSAPPTSIPRSARPRAHRSPLGRALRARALTTRSNPWPSRSARPPEQDAAAARVELASRRAGPLDLPELRRGQAAAHRVRQLRLVRRPPGDRRRVATPVAITVAVDAMGGDPPPGDRRRRVPAADELGVRVLLVGSRTRSARSSPGRWRGAGADHRGRRDARPAGGGAQQEGLVDRDGAELVRDGKADAMVSAGNTGAAMAAALLRMGRIRGVARPAIAVPMPVPGARRRSWSTAAPRSTAPRSGSCSSR